MILVVGNKMYGEPLEDHHEIVSSLKHLAHHPEKISLVLFTGGEDVHPKFYNGGNDTRFCATNENRDLYERQIFNLCRHHDIKMTGICRGFQFLNVMSGGFMYQHITGHTGMQHDAYFSCDGKTRPVTTTHHQLVGLPSSAIPIAWASPKRSKVYIGPHAYSVPAPDHEMEAAIFPHSNAMGVQYHPEMMRENNPTRIHYMNMMLDFMKMSMRDFITKYGRTSYGGNRKARDSGREG